VAKYSRTYIRRYTHDKNKTKSRGGKGGGRRRKERKTSKKEKKEGKQRERGDQIG